MTTITRIRVHWNTRTAIGTETALLPRRLREVENCYWNERTMTERATAVASIAAEWCRIFYHCGRSIRHCYRRRRRPPRRPPIINVYRWTICVRYAKADPHREVRHHYRQTSPPPPPDPSRHVGHRLTPNKCCGDRCHLRCCCCQLSSSSSLVPTGHSPIVAEALAPDTLVPPAPSLERFSRRIRSLSPAQVQ